MNIWYDGESSVYPQLVDTTSSKKWVFVRRNVKEQEREKEDGTTETYYTFQEQKVSKEVWGIFEQEKNNEERLNDVEDVLAELIGAGDIE